MVSLRCPECRAVTDYQIPDVCEDVFCSACGFQLLAVSQSNWRINGILCITTRDFRELSELLIEVLESRGVTMRSVFAVRLMFEELLVEHFRSGKANTVVKCAIDSAQVTVSFDDNEAVFQL
jgi:hypothetical protein